MTQRFNPWLGANRNLFNKTGKRICEMYFPYKFNGELLNK
jgi:hypothetical protein